MHEQILAHLNMAQSESHEYLCFALTITKCGRLPDLLSTNFAFTDPGEGHIELVLNTSFSALENMFCKISVDIAQFSTLNCFLQMFNILVEFTISLLPEVCVLEKDGTLASCSDSFATFCKYFSLCNFVI